jgi:hypothetical protein
VAASEVLLKVLRVDDGRELLVYTAVAIVLGVASCIMQSQADMKCKRQIGVEYWVYGEVAILSVTLTLSQA